MTEEQAERIERKLDVILEIVEPLAKAINSFDELVVEADYVTKAKRLSKQTISRNDKLKKFNGIGCRKILMTLESVAVVKNRKRKFKPSK